MGATMAEKVWDEHVVRRADGEPRPAVHRPASGPRGDEPAGVRGLRLAGRTVRRPDLTIATMDHNVPTTDIDSADRRPDLAQAGRHAAQQLRGVRHPLYAMGDSPAGHRARHRPGAGPHAAGHDDRVRRQPHRRLTARSARWRSASARARSSTCWRRRRCRRSTPEDDGDARRRRARPRRHGEGHHPRDHRPASAPAAARLRHRVPRRGDPRAVDGRADDGVQHVDRRRARGPA